MEHHIAEEHKEDIPEGYFCLSDYCNILDCKGEQERKEESSKCDEANMEKMIYKCRRVFRTCFPTHTGQKSRKMYDLFVRKFCSKFTCQARNQEGPTVEFC